MTKPVLNPPYAVRRRSLENPFLVDKDGHAVAWFESPELAATVAAALNTMGQQKAR